MQENQEVKIEILATTLKTRLANALIEYVGK